MSENKTEPKQMTASAMRKLLVYALAVHDGVVKTKASVGGPYEGCGRPWKKDYEWADQVRQLLRETE